MEDYVNMIGRFFDIRLKASTARIGCIALIIIGIIKILGGDLLDGGALCALGVTLRGIRHAQD